MLRAEIDVRDELSTPFGNLHGGVIAALCDHVLGTVCYPVIPRGAWAATTEFKVNYLAPVTTGVLAATARIVSMTRRTAVVRIDVENEGRLVCAAQGTVLIMQPKSQWGRTRRAPAACLLRRPSHATAPGVVEAGDLPRQTLEGKATRREEIQPRR